MSNPIAALRDDFTNNIIDPTWTGAVSGSATVAETGGQAVLTLPSATAGSHVARYTSNGTYDLTGDAFVWNIATMVATGVVASAVFQMLADAAGTNQLYWRQLSNAITARTIVAGVDTQLFTAAWSAATYKYLRIRESSGTIFFDSSTNGTSWTNRASVANPFVITDLTVQFAATCGNVASPGQLKLDDVNLILPALSSTWRYTQVEWPLLNRFRPITIAAEAGKQGYIAVASSIDASGNLVSPVYYSGPLGSSSGGYNALTLAANQAAAQAMAVNLPLDGRWDLPSIVECRFIRLYHRSTDGASHKLFEYYPRRIVQTDDLEAESIRAINIAAGTITADKMNVITLSAITSNIGQLTLTNPTGAAAWLYQGTGTGDAPTTGLKIFNSGGIGKLSTYNATVEQVTLDTDGALKSGAGSVVLDANGIVITAATSYLYNKSYGFSDGTNRVADVYVIEATGSGAHSLTMSLASKATFNSTAEVVSDAPTGKVSTVQLSSRINGALGPQLKVTSGGGSPGVSIINAALSVLNGNIEASLGIDVGSATGAGTGQISTSSSVGFGVAVNAQARVYVKGVDATSSNYGIIVLNSAATTEFYVRNDGVGFLNAVAWTYSSDARLKEHITNLDAGLDAILALRPKRFDYINGQKNQLGFLAQDVQAILPELVQAQENGMLGMQTTSLIPILVNAIQALARR